MSTETQFADLGLASYLLRAVADAAYTQPTPIQAQAIPLVLRGGDLLAAAQTGTGKTAGFTLPILQRLSEQVPEQQAPGRPRCLILVPTRELAAQVEDAVKTYGKYTDLKTLVMFGGVNINPQFKALKQRVDILVATPGRLLDHVGQKTVDLSGVEILVLDEADRMLDMGFIRDIRKVLALLPKKRQNLLFSATFSDEIKALADGLLDNPGLVEVARRNTASELVAQSVYLVPQAQKRDVLSHLIKEGNWFQVLVFTRTKHGANRLAEKLCKDDIPALAIHGNKSQAARTRALSQFKDGSLPVLVATDIAARGLDIDQLPHVVNFELPNVPEDYVHRIGRTGRAGSEGTAISLVDAEEMKYLNAIQRLLKTEIPRATLENFTPPERPPETEQRPPRQPQRPRHPRPAQGQRHKAQGQQEQSPRQHNKPKQHPPKAKPEHAPQGEAGVVLSEAARHQMLADERLRAKQEQERRLMSGLPIKQHGKGNPGNHNGGKRPPQGQGNRKPGGKPGMKQGFARNGQQRRNTDGNSR